MDELDEPLDDEDRALRYVTARASRYKMQVVVPLVILGTIAGLVCVVASDMRGGKLGTIAAFFGPFVGAVLLASLVLRLTMPLRVGRWLMEAVDRFGVSRPSLLGLLRTTVLPVPSVELLDVVVAAAKTKSVGRYVEIAPSSPRRRGR